MSCNQNCSWLWSLLVLCHILMTDTSCFIQIKSAQREISIIVSETKMVCEFLSQLVHKKITYQPRLFTETYTLPTP